MVYLDKLRAKENIFPSFAETIDPKQNSANACWSFGIVVAGLETKGRRDCSNINSSPKSLNNFVAMSGWSGLAFTTSSFALFKILLEPDKSTGLFN